MFSYSFAVKLTDRSISSQSPEALFDLEGHALKILRKEDSVFLVSSDGYSSLEDAQQQLAATLMKTKVALLKLSIPHLDWWSFNSTQRSATTAIGSLFEKANIVPVSYVPQAYETKRLQHWPGAIPAGPDFDLGALAEIALPDGALKFGTLRTVEALNVLGLALADTHARSKLILAMTAVEILSVRGRVDRDVEDALNALMSKLSEIQVAGEVKLQLKRVLGDAKRESIGKAGKCLVQKMLGDGAAEEFRELYKLRSELVHGNDSRLSINIREHSEIERKADRGFQLALDLTLSLCDIE